MEQRSDEDLLRAFAAGERGALGELADRREREMLGLARGLLCGSDALACEAVQDAWVRVIRSAGKFRGDSSVRTWLYRIVVNRCADVRAREARAQRRAGRDKLSVSDVGDSDTALARAMEKLTDAQRDVVVLCFGRGLSHREAGDVLGLPVGTVKSRTHGAMRVLRDSMGDGADEMVGRDREVRRG